jgi:non-specific serine/threonine protein kinase
MIGKTVSHYKILEELGSGGMGIVYRAEDTKLKRTVALKFLPPDLTRDRAAKERFVQEARAASALDHSNICTIHEIDETDDGQMFIVMACYTGDTLEERIGKGPLPIEEAVRIGTQIAQGLAKAHAQEIIHRDIKPANIFVTEDNEVKIFDFGLAKLAGQTRLTKERTTLGTVAHMSPEQTRSSEVDHRSDIWSFGVVLYEMSVGKLPFTGDHDQAVMYSISNLDPEPLTALRTGVPMELEGIVAKCLEKNPDDRYQRIDEVIVDLNRQSRRLQEPYAPTTSQIARAPRKRRSVGRRVGLLLILALAVIGAFAVYSYFSRSDVESPADKHRKMLVVLPFENLGPSDVEYFADGVTEEITSRLAALSELGVISRTSAMQYKGANRSIGQIGEELGVDYVLEGTVRWDKPGEGGSRVRVTPQLIRVADDTHLWSERYDRVLEDIFDVQSEIAAHVIDQLNVTLLEPERRIVEARPTDNMAAYQAYLRGREYASRAFYSARIWHLTIEMFERAVELDPKFALAWADLANAHSSIFNMGAERTQEHVDECKVAVDRALDLQPDLPEAQIALGFYYYHGLRDYDRALEVFEAAGRLLPNQNDILQQIGWICRRQSKWDEALDHLRRSAELNPRDANLQRELGNTNVALRRYDKALEYYDRSIVLAPDQVWSYGMKALAYWLRSGDLARARAALEEAPGEREPFVDYLWYWQEMMEENYEAALERVATAGVECFEMPGRLVPTSMAEGGVYHLMGDSLRAHASFDSARELLEPARINHPDDSRIHASLGVVYAALGRREAAVREAKRAMEITPVSADGLRGTIYIESLAWTYALIGEYEAALDQIDHLLSIPAWVSVTLLRKDARLGSLRGHPEFERVLQKHSKASS